MWWGGHTFHCWEEAGALWRPFPLWDVAGLGWLQLCGGQRCSPFELTVLLEACHKSVLDPRCGPGVQVQVTSKNALSSACRSGVCRGGGCSHHLSPGHEPSRGPAFSLKLKSVEGQLGRKGPSAPLLERGRRVPALAPHGCEKGGGAGLAAGGRAGEPRSCCRGCIEPPRAVPSTQRSLAAPELGLNFPSPPCVGDRADTLRGAEGEAGKKKSERGGGKEVPEGFI